jgi:aspartate/methionine/tyrosine aminotransferase
MRADLPDFRLEVYLGKWEFAARHHLTASDAQTLSVAEVLGPEGLEELAALSLGYTPTWGTDALRAAIAATYDRVEPDDVLVFAGAEEAMFWAMQELVGPGGHAVVTVPNYQSMESVTVATGAAVSGLSLRPENGWALDLDALAALMRPETKLVAVNFPNNPTGALPDPDTWAALVALCEERGIRLFSDEVYRGLEADGTAPLSHAADVSPTALSVGVMSKAYGLPGLRIGWLACRDHAMLERLETRKHYTSICSAAPSELIATYALRRGAEITARNRAIIARNLPVFDAFFAEHADLFAWEHPQAGCVCFPRYLGADGVEAFCHDLVEQAGVVLLPASIYASELGDVPPDRFRIGVGRADPESALEAFGAFLAERSVPSSHA